MSAATAPIVVADHGRQPIGDWDQIAASAPRLAATVDDHLVELATTLTPASVKATGAMLRQFAGYVTAVDPHCTTATADIATPLPLIGSLVRWLVGGLDHQIADHLAPRLPHTIYPLLAKRFRHACHDNGITCRLHPGVWAALRSHTRWLRAMGIPPA